MNNIAFGNNNFGYYKTLFGGAGATEDYHGANAVHTHMTNTRITDVEILEIQFPIQLLNFMIRPASGCKGKYNGGNGIIRTYKFLEDMEISLLTERRVFSPYGMNGGDSGKKGLNIRISLDGKEIPLKGKDYYKAKAGECLRMETPGGGAWGRL